jgi:SMP-30/Gluconolactonase/LRE-like region
MGRGLGPDGICMDADGAVWVQTADTPHGAVVRIREGIEVLERIEHDRTIFATMLGGPDRTTLFLLAAKWRGIEHVDEALAARTGQVLITKAPAPRPAPDPGMTPGPHTWPVLLLDQTGSVGRIHPDSSSEPLTIPLAA